MARVIAYGKYSQGNQMSAAFVRDMVLICHKSQGDYPKPVDLTYSRMKRT